MYSKPHVSIANAFIPIRTHRCCWTRGKKLPKKWRVFNSWNTSCGEKHILEQKKWPGQFPGIAGNAENHGNDGKFDKSRQLLNQTKRNTNKLCLGKISRHKTVRTKFFMDFGFRTSSVVKRENPETPETNRKLSKLKST